MSSIRIPRLWNPSSHISHLRISHYLLNAVVQTDRHLFVGRRGLEKFVQNAYALVWRKIVNSSFFREIIFEKIFVKSTFWKQVGRVAFFKGLITKGLFYICSRRCLKTWPRFQEVLTYQFEECIITFCKSCRYFSFLALLFVPLMIKCSFACRPSEFK